MKGKVSGAIGWYSLLILEVGLAICVLGTQAMSLPTRILLLLGCGFTIGACLIQIRKNRLNDR